MSNQHTLDSLIPIAIEAALQGFFEVKEASGKPMILEDKGGCDACTYWDNHLEDVTKALFEKKTPEITVFAEETKDRNDSQWTRKQHKLWILDAIDGTPNFKDGLPQWGKAVAYLEGDECLINAIAIPSENALYVAQKGKGAFMINLLDRVFSCSPPRIGGATIRIVRRNYFVPDKDPIDNDCFVSSAINSWNYRGAFLPDDKILESYQEEVIKNAKPVMDKLGLKDFDLSATPIKPCSTTQKTSKIQVGYDLGYVDRGQKLTHIISRFSDDKSVYYTPCIGSASYGLCAVASGRLGAYMIIGVDINDIYPGMLLVKEAGGEVSDQFGNPITRESGTLIASANKDIHKFLLDSIRPATENKDIASIWKYRKAK